MSSRRLNLQNKASGREDSIMFTYNHRTCKLLVDLHGDHRAPATGHTSVHLLGGSPEEASPPRAGLGGAGPEGPTGRGSGTGALRPHSILAGALPQT